MVTDPPPNELAHDWLAKHRKRRPADEPANDQHDTPRPAA